MESSQSKDFTHVPYIGQWILNHWTTRKSKKYKYLNNYFYTYLDIRDKLQFLSNVKNVYSEKISLLVSGLKGVWVILGFWGH